MRSQIGDGFRRPGRPIAPSSLPVAHETANGRSSPAAAPRPTDVLMSSTQGRGDVVDLGIFAISILGAL